MRRIAERLEAECCMQLASDAELLDRFEGALGPAGYSLAHADEYAKLRLRVVDEGLFQVRDDFPRLTVTQPPAGIPSGVERVEYEINLSGFSHLCTARRPADASNL